MKNSTKELLTYIGLLAANGTLTAANLTLRCLLIALGGAEFLIEKPFYQQLRLDGRRTPSSYTKRKQVKYKMANRFSKLEFQGFIEKRKRGSRFLYVLTTKGILRLLKASIQCAPRLKGKQFIFVSYDIPEDHRLVRNLFREFLSESGLRLFHESLLFCDRDIEICLKHFIDTYNLGPWVKVVRGTIIV